jgi:REJ domain
LSVCVSASPNSTLVIPSNTLWYGTYRINTTVYAASPSVGGSTTLLPVVLDTSAPSTTYLTVTPSPLVAAINKLITNETISLDLSASGDPDVAHGNDTGLNLYLFCYPQKKASTYSGLTLNQMLQSATSLANNRLVKSECFFCNEFQ